MRHAILITIVLAAVSPVTLAAPQTAHTLHSQRRPGQTDHVVVSLKVEGKTRFTDRGKSQNEKMRVACELEYDEKTLEVPAKVEGLWRSARNYTQAAAVVSVGGDEFKPTLRSDRRLICAEATAPQTLLFSPPGPLNRTELELIDVPGNSLLLDQLLPEKAVATDDTWKHSEQLMAAMLGLDEVAKTDVESRLKEVTDKVARCEIGGRLEGAVHGVSTQIELRGKYRFDLRSKRIDWLALAIKEDRQSSLVADGIDAQSVIQVTVRGVGGAADRVKIVGEKLPWKSSPELTQLTYESASGDWQFDHDRRWYVFRDQRDAAVLRMLDRGETLGQCNVSSLPERAPDKLVSLEEFQADVRRALNKNFGEFVEAGEKTHSSKHRVLRVVAEGKASDIPIQWVYYHVADQQGHQAAFTFTVEKSLLARFADADIALVQSLRFVEPATKAQDSKTAKRYTVKGQQ